MLPKYLASLDDRFYLINWIHLAGKDGDIDHILVGPPGIFVIETKNHGWYVSCTGDSWDYKRVERDGSVSNGHIRSPSRQVKANARHLRESPEKTLRYSQWVEAVVAFIHPKARIDVSDPAVAVLHGGDVSEYIRPL